MAEPAAPQIQERGGLRIPVAERLGDRIGPYKLLERIGEGGWGVVYMAQQEQPIRRLVALKVIKLGMDTRQVIARFEAERQALALMDHPNIAKVLDAGATEAGRPFFVMELVRGVRITEYCDQNQLATKERLELFIQVCRAVQHAHQKGVIHRDLKPSNILVTVNDSRPVPKIIDFGIAKATQERLTDKTLVTAFAQFIGTPAYMSPEQVVMTSLDVDTRSDVYSLGVLLYELLTGRLPFATDELLAAGLEEMRRTIREREPLPPSTRLSRMTPSDLTNVARARQSDPARLQGVLRRDLDWIVMKCLEKDRSRRYDTASGLARDIERHLGDEPIMARPPSRLYRWQKTVRRHWVGLSTAAAILLSLAIALVVSTVEAIHARRAEREQRQLHAMAQAAQLREAALRLSEQRLLYASKMREAQAAWEENQIGRVRALLNQTADYPDRGFEWFYWQRQLHLPLKTLRGHLDQVWAVAFSPDGRRMATSGKDETTIIWDATTGERLFTLKGHRGAITALDFSPDGRHLVTASLDATAKVWDVFTGKDVLTLIGHKSDLWGAAFSPDGQRVVTGSVDRLAKVWDAANGNLLLILEGHTKDINAVAFSPDGRLIATASDDHTAKIWDGLTGRPLRTLAGHADTVHSVAFSPDSRRLVTGSEDKTAKVWDVNTSGTSIRAANSSA
jgi:serine/threonine protein kinase